MFILTSNEMMTIKDYVNWFYKEKIEWKDPTLFERRAYWMLCLFYVLTTKYELIWDLNKDSEMIQVSDWQSISLTLYIYWVEVLVKRKNNFEIVNNIDDLVSALYWISLKL